MKLTDETYNYIVSRIVYWIAKTVRAVDAYWVEETEYGHISWSWPTEISEENLDLIRKYYVADLFILQDGGEIYLPHSCWAIDRNRAELFEKTWELVDYDNPLELQATIGVCIPLLYYELHGQIYTGIIPHICQEECLTYECNEYEMLTEKFDLTKYSEYIVSCVKRTKILDIRDINKNSILLGFNINETNWEE